MMVALIGKKMEKYEYGGNINIAKSRKERDYRLKS
jgi:hypothetical protein